MTQPAHKLPPTPSPRVLSLQMLESVRSLREQLRQKAPDLLVTADKLDATLQAFLAQAEHEREEVRWRLWFGNLPAPERQQLAAKASARGLAEPEGFEAARAVVWGDHIAAQMTPDELALLASGEDLAPERQLTLDELEQALATEGGLHGAYLGALRGRSAAPGTPDTARVIRA